MKEFFDFDSGGIRPIRACGSRWISHKLNAMKRILSKYGAYTQHLAALSEDSSIKSTDRAKLQGYYKKWTQGQYVVGCAVFVDLLTPCAIFSKVMQVDEIDILGALTSLMKTIKETDKLKSRPLKEWPTYAALKKKLKREDGKIEYQAQELRPFKVGDSYYTEHYQDYCSKVTGCIKSRLSWSDLDLVRDIVVILSTHGWEKIREESEEEPAKDSITRVAERFRVPLEGAGAIVDDISTEFADMIDYAIAYISLSTLDYHSVWWKLFHAPDATTTWSSALILVELLFSLPASNGKVERVFSLVNTIKTNKRSLLNNNSLDDLITLNSDKIPLANFSPNSGIDLWWGAATRRPTTTRARRPYTQRKRATETESSSAIVNSDTQDESDTESDAPIDLLTQCDDLLQDS